MSLPTPPPEFKSVCSLGLMRDGAPLRGNFAAASLEEVPQLDLGSIFTTEEIAAIEAFKFPARRQSFLLGRLAAKRALLGSSDLTAAAARSIAIRRGVFEQPLVQGTDAELSIAHSATAAIAISAPSGHPIGVDFEKMSGRELDALLPNFTAPERTLLERAFGPFEQAVYSGWTIKEALAKALRCGLMTPLPVLEISTIDVSKTVVESRFTNFAQYKACTWIAGEHALSIVLPHRTSISFRPPAALAGLL